MLDYRDYNPSNQRGLSQSLREHCLRQLFYGRGNQSHARSYGTLHLISSQKADGRHPLGYRFSANSEARRDDRASHNSGVREGRGPKAIYWQPQKVSTKRHERESRKIKFRLRCQFKGNSLLNKFDP
jgi:hypothetical protein